MLSTQRSTQPSAPTTNGTPSHPRATGRVKLEVALVAELVIDVEVDGSGADACDAAIAGALESQARLRWDDASLSCALRLKALLLDQAPLVSGLSVYRVAAGEAPELLVKRQPDEAP